MELLIELKNLCKNINVKKNVNTDLFENTLLKFKMSQCRWKKYSPDIKKFKPANNKWLNLFTNFEILSINTLQNVY